MRLRASGEGVNGSADGPATTPGEEIACREAGIDLSLWDVIDRADLEPAPGFVTLLVARSRSSNRPLAAVWTTADAAPDCASSPRLDAAICARLGSGGHLVTAAGGRLRFHGLASSPEGSRSLPHAWSTNLLSLVELDGREYVHKRYRRLRPDQHERQVLQALAGTPHTATYRGHYTYEPPGGHAPLPLGHLYGYVPGHTLDALLRDSLRRTLAASVAASHPPHALPPDAGRFHS